MKLKFKNIGLLALGFAASVSFTSCTGDLNVEPIDPTLSTPNQVLTTKDAYRQLLSNVYGGLAYSGSTGSNSPLTGVDAGYSQYFRALFTMQELPTDEAINTWNDQTIRNFHGLCWGSSDVFVFSMFWRLVYQIQEANEVVRQLKAASVLDDDTKAEMIAEAKALRDFSYLHAIDMFGGFPFQTEENSMTQTPSYIKRADLYTWLESDLKSIVDQLPDVPEKYAAGKGFVYMMLAKLHLNAEVYAGKNAYADCVQDCQNILNLGYKLESAANWHNMFQAQNDKYLACKQNGMGHEIIFSTYQDMDYTQAYGSTDYIIHAAAPSTKGGDFGLVGSGWAGNTVTSQFVDRFEANDQRGGNLIYTDGMQKVATSVMVQFTKAGYSYKKFTNFNEDGTTPKGNDFVNTDMPVFRLADVYLMLAECEARGASVNVNGHNGAWYYNQIRERAGVSTNASPSLQNILDERSRELAWECVRRTDLVRFNQLTDGPLWDMKGMNNDNGTAHNVDSHYNLYPIPSTERSNNPAIDQNPGY